MVEIKSSGTRYASALATLIYDSAEEVFNFLFTSKDDAVGFLKQAVHEDDGQFSARRHQVALWDGQLVGCVSLWSSELPDEFHQGTLHALQQYLRADLLEHVVKVNPQLVQTFCPPKPHQLCFGHLSVKREVQGQGVGSKLMAYVLRQAKTRKKSEVVLDVNSENHQAIGFYHKAGFVEKQTNYFPPLALDFYRMIKTID